MRWWLLLLVGLGLIGTFASVALALAISGLIENIAHRKPIEVQLLYWFVFGVVLKVAVLVFQDRFAAVISGKVKQAFRSELLSSDFSHKEVSSAELTILATRGLDALDAYFGKFLPQFVYSIVVTPVMVILFLCIDPISSIILVFTIPLIPLFMVFIGMATKVEQDRQMESLTKLSTHFAEVVRGISTLKLFKRIDHQLEVLKAIGDNLRIKTMKVLRISFLSGFALELTASLSVALIAVAIGFRLLDGLIPFSTAMFLLILAPEVYLPIRMIGSNYHASTEGISAATRILNILEAKDSVSPSLLPQQPGLEVWIGPSGSGKSSAMERLVFGENGHSVSWMPQQAVLLPTTVMENISGQADFDSRIMSWCIETVGLKDVTLDQEIDEFGRGLSGGQAQRVSLARALYRLKSKNLKSLLLDEPTSSLDDENSDRIWYKLSELSKTGVAVTVITHQEKFIPFARRVIRFE